MTNDADAAADLGALLVSYRMAIYLGGVAVIALPLALHSGAGVTLSRSVRAALTVAPLTLMVLTYAAERRLGGPSDGDTGGEAAERTSRGDRGYPLRMRVAVAMAGLGLAAGVYVWFEVSPIAGLLFVAGSYLFAYLAYEPLGDER